ncbi:unnamed protein product, partial [Iphiclides podalirius]
MKFAIKRPEKYDGPLSTGVKQITRETKERTGQASCAGGNGVPTPPGALFEDLMRFLRGGRTRMYVARRDLLPPTQRPVLGHVSVYVVRETPGFARRLLGELEPEHVAPDGGSCKSGVPFLNRFLYLAPSNRNSWYWWCHDTAGSDLKFLLKVV